MNTRLSDLKKWLDNIYKQDLDLAPINNDASFRKYYRINNLNINNKILTKIAVDSPPDKEKNNEFIVIQKILENNNINVPKIYNYDKYNGFFVIEDFGDDILLPKLIEYKENYNKIELLYKSSLEQLNKIQQISYINNNFSHIDIFSDKLLKFEMELFREWFVNKYLKLELSQQENLLLDNIFEFLIKNALEQPQTLVHRDFHSRNLLILNNINNLSEISALGLSIGVIDFQDAVWGPVTYDLVSLYRDCYINWPDDLVKDWVKDYFNYCKNTKILSDDINFDLYWRWFLLMTLQRNFKTIGIFSRLFLRDNKSGYLKDIPRTLNYAIYSICSILEFTDIYKADEHTKDFKNLLILLEEKIKPRLNLVLNPDLMSKAN